MSKLMLVDNKLMSCVTVSCRLSAPRFCVENVILVRKNNKQQQFTSPKGVMQDILASTAYRLRMVLGLLHTLTEEDA